MSTTHVVIVEDDNYSIDVLSDLLDLLNVDHTAVHEGSQIVQVMQKLPKVDVIFLDLELPNQDGYKVLKAIQADSRFNRIPVVAYTSHVNEMSNARRAGFHSFLGKPVLGNKFPDQLSRILNNQPVWE